MYSGVLQMVNIFSGQLEQILRIQQAANRSQGKLSLFSNNLQYFVEKLMVFPAPNFRQSYPYPLPFPFAVPGRLSASLPTGRTPHHGPSIRMIIRRLKLLSRLRISKYSQRPTGKAIIRLLIPLCHGTHQITVQHGPKIRLSGGTSAEIGTLWRTG